MIVGAGGGGLSLSLLLLQQGIRPLVVERRADTSWYPRARNLNFRSLEIFRGLGLAEEIHRTGTRVSRIFAREHLASHEQKQVMDPATLLDTRAISPEPFLWYCPQSLLEPMLRRTARERGAEVCYGTELIDIVEDGDEVQATLLDQKTGQSRIVHAQYLVGADGAHSTVRDRSAIPASGKGVLDEHYAFIYARADWGRFVQGFESDAFLIENSRARGMFLIAEDNLGMFVVTQAPGSGRLSNDAAEALLRDAVGKSDLPIEIVEVAPWQPEQRVAQVFQRGRVFLVGDAAHTMPPKEGLGVNSAIQGAQNLGWKLATVLQGKAGPELLHTYEAERLPVALFAANHSMTGPAAALLEKTAIKEKASEFFPIIGYRYRSQAVMSQDGPASPPDEIALLDREELIGAPGTRVPHVWFERASVRISTLDLFDGSFVLLTDSDDPAWREAVKASAGRLGVKLALYRIGRDGDLQDPAGEWPAAFGVQGGAMLLRPDGFVAWRGTHAADRTALLDQILAGILCHSMPETVPA